MTPSENLRGALLMTASMASFTVNDAFLKWLGQSLPFFQILSLRTVLVVAILGLFVLRNGMGSVTEGDRRLILIRTVAEIGAAFFFISALFHIPIANVSAIIQALPLTVTLGAALLFREAVGWRRLTAILIGMLGVLLIIRPGGADFSIHSLYAVGAVVCVTVRDLSARRLSANVPTLTVAFAAAVGVLLFSVVGLAFEDWQPMREGHWVAVLGSAVFIIGGYIFSVAAMRVGEIGVVAQFRYSALLVALILGFLVFGEWPDAMTLIGAAIVVATGLYTLWREHHVRAEPALRPR